MIAEALDAARLVASALAAWLVVGGVAVTVGLYAVVVAGWGIWRVVRSAWGAVGPRTDSLAPLADEQPAEDREPPDVSDGHSGPPLSPTPSWARKDAA